jgi:hypothetical protein
VEVYRVVRCRGYQFLDNRLTDGSEPYASTNLHVGHALTPERSSNGSTLLVTAKVVPTSPIVTLMMGAICSFEKSDLTRATRRHIQEDGILHSHCRKNLRS